MMDALELETKVIEYRRRVVEGHPSKEVFGTPTMTQATEGRNPERYVDVEMWITEANLDDEGEPIAGKIIRSATYSFPLKGDGRDSSGFVRASVGEALTRLLHEQWADEHARMLLEEKQRELGG